MITIILNHHNKYAEVEMPAMYEELQLALWKLGLDRVPEKYTLQDLEATFRYQSPLEYFVLRLLEGEMNLLDAVSAIYTVIAPPRPIMAQVQILSSGFRSITELRQEIDRMIKSSAQFGSTCFFPVRGWLVGLDGEMEPARDAVLLQHAEVIGEAVQRMQSWIIHDMALCFADTETDAEESLFQKILSARWSVEKRGRKLYGRIDLLMTEDLTPEEQEALEEKTRRITTQDMALRLDRWSVLTDKGILYINFGTGREKVFDMDDDIVDDDESNCSEGCLCPECEARLKKYGNISAEDISDVEWLDFLVVGDHTLPRPIDISDLEDTDE